MRREIENIERSIKIFYWLIYTLSNPIWRSDKIENKT